MKFMHLPENSEMFGSDPVEVYAVEKLKSDYSWREEWGKKTDCILGHTDFNQLGDIIINTKTGELFLFTTFDDEWDISIYPALQATFEEIHMITSMLWQDTDIEVDTDNNKMYTYDIIKTINPDDIRSKDLQEEACETDNWTYAVAQTYKEEEPVEVLYRHGFKEAGISRKSKTVWTVADSVKNALDRYYRWDGQDLKQLFKRKPPEISNVITAHERQTSMSP